MFHECIHVCVLLQIGDHKLNYNHYEQLYDAEKKVEIKVVPKLTEYHIKPQKLQAMNVRLAAQVRHLI